MCHMWSAHEIKLMIQKKGKYALGAPPPDARPLG